MSQNPKDPMSRFYEEDIQRGNRSNFNWSYKNRISADFGYLYPVGLWDLPANTDFKLNVKAVLSSNPTIGPVLGNLKFRLEAYYIEKAAYVPELRNNNSLDVSRNVPFPYFTEQLMGRNQFAPRTGLLNYLQMFPAEWSNKMFNGDAQTDSIPRLNAIPLLMYYDIFRNFYYNPQDGDIPFRVHGYVPPPSGEAQDAEQISDHYITKSELDNWIMYIRNGNPDVPDMGRNVLEAWDYAIGGGGWLAPFSGTNLTNYPTDTDHRRYAHRGLLRRTLNNDFFTSFISNDNVAVMRSKGNVQVSNNLVSVEQISLANRNWRIATRSLLWGTDWKDFNKVHYGVNLLIPYGRPQFLGALSSNVYFNDVISQSQTGESQDVPVSANTNLGSRAGLAFGGLKNHNGYFVDFRCKDEGYVMVLASLVPEVDYYQGIDPMYFKINLQHSWLPEYNSVGMQDFMRAWQTVVLGNGNTTMSFPSWNVADHKVPIWFEYMAKYNQLHGDFTAENLLRYWVFARPFTSLAYLFPGVFESTDEQPSDEPYLSTYVLPEMFNYIFANNLGNDNFQLQFNWDCKANNMLDKQITAYL